MRGPDSELKKKSPGFQVRGRGRGYVLAKIESLATSRSEFDLSGLMILRPLTDPAEVRAYDEKMFEAVQSILYPECSPPEWESWCRKQPVQSVFDKLDNILIRMANTYTWRLLYCWLLRDRYAQWCSDENIAMLKKYHAAIEERIRISRGESKGKVTTAWVAGRARAIPELRALFRTFNGEVRQRKDRIPTFPEARERLLQIIAQKFPPKSWIGMNYECLSGYLKKIAENDPTRARRICNGEMRAETLFIGLGARSLHISEEHFRNQLSIASWRRP